MSVPSNYSITPLETTMRSSIEKETMQDLKESNVAEALGTRLRDSYSLPRELAPAE